VTDTTAPAKDARGTKRKADDAQTNCSLCTQKIWINGSWKCDCSDTDVFCSHCMFDHPCDVHGDTRGREAEAAAAATSSKRAKCASLCVRCGKRITHDDSYGIKYCSPACAKDDPDVTESDDDDEVKFANAKIQAGVATTTTSTSTASLRAPVDGSTSTNTSTTTTTVSLKLEPVGVLAVMPGRLDNMKEYRKLEALQVEGMANVWPTIDAYLEITPAVPPVFKRTVPCGRVSRESYHAMNPDDSEHYAISYKWQLLPHRSFRFLDEYWVPHCTHIVLQNEKEEPICKIATPFARGDKHRLPGHPIADVRKWRDHYFIVTYSKRESDSGFDMAVNVHDSDGKYLYSFCREDIGHDANFFHEYCAINDDGRVIVRASDQYWVYQFE
jgi:hypothetical protein